VELLSRVFVENLVDKLCALHKNPFAERHCMACTILQQFGEFHVYRAFQDCCDPPSGNSFYPRSRWGFLWISCVAALHLFHFHKEKVLATECGKAAIAAWQRLLGTRGAGLSPADVCSLVDKL